MLRKSSMSSGVSMTSVQRGDRRIGHVLLRLPSPVEHDVGDHFPLAGGIAVGVQRLDARGLLVGVLFAGLGERGFLGRELLNDFVDLRSSERSCGSTARARRPNGAAENCQTEHNHLMCAHIVILLL